MTERNEKIPPQSIPSLDELVLRTENLTTQDDTVADEDRVVDVLIQQGVDVFDLAAHLARESKMTVGEIPSLNGVVFVHEDESIEIFFKFLAADIIGAKRLKRSGMGD